MREGAGLWAYLPSGDLLEHCLWDAKREEDQRNKVGGRAPPFQPKSRWESSRSSENARGHRRAGLGERG